MADNHPLCVLKVDLQGCQIHPKKVNKELQKINGVYATDIDTEEGLVMVSGLIEPRLLIETIQKLGIETQLLAYEKNPRHANMKQSRFLKKLQSENVCPSKGKKNNPDKTSDQPAYPLEDSFTSTDVACCMRPHGSSWHHPSYDMKSISRWPMPRPRLVQPSYAYGVMPNMLYTKRARPPLPYPFDIYGAKQKPEVGNTYHQFFSDDTVGPCHIM